MTSLQAGSPDTQACINAGSTVSGIISDLDKTIKLATAGTLQAKSENESFSDHSENILKAAKVLKKDIKNVVKGAVSSQEQLVVAAQNVVTSIIQLSDLVRNAAVSLGSNNRGKQVLLIIALKDIVTAFCDLFLNIKAEYGRSIDDPEMSNMKCHAQAMFINIRLLLRAVRSVESEHSRCIHDPEFPLAATGQEQRPSGNAVKGATCGVTQELISGEEININDIKELTWAREKLTALRKAEYEELDENQDDGCQ